MKLQSLHAFVAGNPPPFNGGRYFVFRELVTACVTGPTDACPNGLPVGNQNTGHLVTVSDWIAN